MSIIKASVARRVSTANMLPIQSLQQPQSGGLMDWLLGKKVNPIEQAMNEMSAEAFLEVKQAEANALVAVKTSEIERKATTAVLTQQHQQHGVERTYQKLETQARIDTVNFIAAASDAGLNTASGLKDDALRQCTIDAIRQIAGNEITSLVND